MKCKCPDAPLLQIFASAFSWCSASPRSPASLPEPASLQRLPQRSSRNMFRGLSSCSLGRQSRQQAPHLRKTISQLFLRFVIGHHHRGFWPTEGWSFTHLTKVSKQKRFSPRFSETSPKDRVFEFYKLYLPSALAIASDFWRVTVIGVIAASRGSVEVGRQ